MAERSGDSGHDRAPASGGQTFDVATGAGGPAEQQGHGAVTMERVRLGRDLRDLVPIPIESIRKFHDLRFDAPAALDDALQRFRLVDRRDPLESVEKLELAIGGKGRDRRPGHRDAVAEPGDTGVQARGHDELRSANDLADQLGR